MITDPCVDECNLGINKDVDTGGWTSVKEDEESMQYYEHANAFHLYIFHCDEVDREGADYTKGFTVIKS